LRRLPSLWPFFVAVSTDWLINHLLKALL
jgi:hypothetical protein